jgi:hypothetical protein
MTISNVGSGDRVHVTVRERGGEIWAELSSFPDGELPWQIKSRVVDLIMGVVARHVGAAIGNDAVSNGAFAFASTIAMPSMSRSSTITKILR